MPWQPALEDCIEEIGVATVFVGRDGIGAWQDMEIQAYLREFVRRRWINGGDQSSRMVWGGSLLSDLQLCRSAFRGGVNSDYRNLFIGFRVACSSA